MLGSRCLLIVIVDYKFKNSCKSGTCVMDNGHARRDNAVGDNAGLYVLVETVERFNVCASVRRGIHVYYRCILGP